MADFWDDLPARQKAVDALAARCPWCRQDVGEATITVDTLLEAWENDGVVGSGNWLWRGRRFDQGIPADCPSCSKPMLIKMVVADYDERRHLVIAATRTEADERFLCDATGARQALSREAPPCPE